MFWLFVYIFIFLDVIVFMTMFVGLYLCLTIAEMVLAKVIYILRFSIIAIMDEYFITAILNMFNIVFVSILVILRMVSKDHETTSWYNFVNRGSYQGKKQKNEKQIFFFR